MKIRKLVYKATALLMTVVFPLQVLAGACDTLVAESGPAPGALGVLKDGTIKVQANGESNCAILFGGDSTVINAQTGNYTTRGSGCSTSSGTKVAETGSYLNTLSSLPTFLTPASNAAQVVYANSGQVIKFTSNSVTHEYALKDSSSSSSYRWCKNNTGNGCNNNNSKESDYVKYTSHLKSGWGAFPYYGNSTLNLVNTSFSGTVYPTAYNKDKETQSLYGYELVDVNTANGVYFNYSSAAGAYKITKLRLSADNATVTFEPGTYYIGTLETTSKFVIKVASSGGDGSGTVKLYINSMSMNNLNGSCINVSSCPGSGVLNTTAAAENPERLYIYVLNGDFTLNDRVSMAAGIYVPNGTFTMGNNNATFVGEALAKNISLQNGGSSSDPMDIIYKDTGIFASLYSGSSSTTEVIKEGIYSLAPPAVPRETASGSLVYVPYQTDYYQKSDGSYSYYGGHLMAFKMNADGTTETTAKWDADDEMTVTERTDRLYSSDSSGNLTKFALLTGDSIFGSVSPTSAEIVAYTLNPAITATYRGKRDPNTLIGRPYTTQPVIAENLGQVYFHTDDGFLYAVDSTTGDLKWGFMPRALLSGLKDYSGFYKTHAMEGQIAVQEYTSGTTNYAYVVGSAKGGSVHYALRVSSSGITRLWEDNTAGTVPHRPVIFQAGSTYYAMYLTGTNTVTVRSLSASYSEKTYNLGTSTGTLTAAPIILESFDLSSKTRKQTLKLYIGDNKGYAYEAVLGSGGSLSGSLSLTTVGNVGTTSTVADPVKYLQTATLGGYDYLTVQTETRLKTFRLPNAASWLSRWISKVGESGYWNDTGSTYTKETLFTPNTEHIQKLPSTAKVTDQVEIAESVVFLPVQVEETSGTTQVCNAYYYLYRLDKGYFPYNTLRIKTPVTDNVLIGTGKAYKPSITILGGEVTLEGHSEKNNLNATGGTSLGLDDPFSFTKGENGISGWRELLDE